MIITNKARHHLIGCWKQGIEPACAAASVIRETDMPRIGVEQIYQVYAVCEAETAIRSAQLFAQRYARTDTAGE
jgi:hypothetical protein